MAESETGTSTDVPCGTSTECVISCGTDPRDRLTELERAHGCNPWTQRPDNFTTEQLYQLFTARREAEEADRAMAEFPA